MKPKLGSYTKSFMSLWEEFVKISCLFLLFVIEEDNFIGFFWLLCWYLSRIAEIVAEGFWCCPVLCL